MWGAVAGVGVGAASPITEAHLVHRPGLAARQSAGIHRALVRWDELHARRAISFFWSRRGRGSHDPSTHAITEAGLAVSINNAVAAEAARVAGRATTINIRLGAVALVIVAARAVVARCIVVVVVVRLWRYRPVRRLLRRLRRRREHAPVINTRERVLAVVSILAAIAPLAGPAIAPAAVDVRLVAVAAPVATRAALLDACRRRSARRPGSRSRTCRGSCGPCSPSCCSSSAECPDLRTG